MGNKIPGSSIAYCSSVLQETWIQRRHAILPWVGFPYTDCSVLKVYLLSFDKLSMISYGLSEGKANEKGLQIDAQVKQEQVCIASI